MKFKAKVFKLGNSRAMYIPKSFIIGKEYEFVYTGEAEVYTGPKVLPQKKEEIITREHFNTQWCPKHSVMKGSCDCK